MEKRIIANTKVDSSIGFHPKRHVTQECVSGGTCVCVRVCVQLVPLTHWAGARVGPALLPRFKETSSLVFGGRL